jgi:tryptophan halogenase
MTENQTRRIRHVAIVGGGTAGWIAASVLARALSSTGCAVTVVESTQIGTVGVGEATIPPFVDLLKFLSIDLADFVRHTGSTYKLGIKFTDWSRVGRSYWHPFGGLGASINRRPFFHAWHKARAEGLAVDLASFSLCMSLGEQGRFRFPDPGADRPASGLKFALHFDAERVSQYLRAYAERLGVRRLERTVSGATQRDDGFIESLVFDDGGRLEADLFIDCSGFRALLIEKTLKTGYEDWSALLPCDRAAAMPTALKGPRPPYTQAFARSAGWRWSIPLQHRVGNGYVYCSGDISDQAAMDDLVKEVGPGLAEPRLLRFVTGRRKAFWVKNCVALGLASGFLEPLESTSIHLAISGVYNLLDHFPDLDFDSGNIAAYNAELGAEMERIRDFIVLHYALTNRHDAPLWRRMRALTLPDSLKTRLELYRATGRVRSQAGELFTDLSWFYVLEGMGVRPVAYDPLMDVVAPLRLRAILAELAAETAAAANSAPAHDSFFSHSFAA